MISLQRYHGLKCENDEYDTLESCYLF